MSGQVVNLTTQTDNLLGKFAEVKIPHYRRGYECSFECPTCNKLSSSTIPKNKNVHIFILCSACKCKLFIFNYGFDAETQYEVIVSNIVLRNWLVSTQPDVGYVDPTNFSDYDQLCRRYNYDYAYSQARRLINSERNSDLLAKFKTDSASEILSVDSLHSENNVKYSAFSEFSMPPGKDHVLILGVNSQDECFLATTQKYDDEVTAWTTVDSGRLHNDITVKKYRFLLVSKTDIDLCYICEKVCSGEMQYLLCANLNYHENEQSEVYYSTYTPFFIIYAHVDSVNYLDFYKFNRNNFVHYKSYKEAESRFIEMGGP